VLLALLLAVSAPPLLVFHGNVVLLDDVYRSLLDLPAGTRATPETARSVATRLSRFLHRAGYDLATVKVHLSGEQIFVDVDEGQLDKVIFLGGGAIETLRFKLDLTLPERVFNRPQLERQLKELARRVGLAEFAYELVPVDAPGKQFGPQLDQIVPIDDLPLFQPGRPYELHILIIPGPFRRGFSPELEIDSLEGYGIGGDYQSMKLVSPDDHWHVGGRIAGAVRDRLDTGATRLSFTRLSLDGTWEGPAITTGIRPVLRGRVDLSDRQRADLRLESFKFATLDMDLALRVQPSNLVRLSLGLGLERRFLFAAERLPDTVGDTSSLAQTRSYGEASLLVRLNPGELRRDRGHELELAARLYGRGRADLSGSVRLSGRYQKMFALGWNELWLESYGEFQDGDIRFPEEQSIGGDPLRGPFGSIYARKLLSFGVEYRYSLVRDVFKLGLFHNAVAFGSIDRENNHESPLFADSFGLGAHALIYEEFALDAWFGWGFAGGGKTDHGAALQLRQAF
jgi:hypothetical protein